jgi:endonuclease/exonuclease/phosphatase family metal-dependent hydrolase
MKLLQLNIWEGRLLRQIIPFIEEIQPDILCLQEVFSCEEYIEKPTRMFSSFEHIFKSTGHQYFHYSPEFKMDVENKAVTYGVAIISAFPLTKTKTFHTHDPHASNEKYKSNKGILQAAEITVGKDQKMTVFNLHGYWEPNSHGSETTVECMKKVADITSEYKGPIILSGDFNVVDESPAMRVFDGKYQNVTAKHKVKYTLTELGKVQDVACDKILISDEIIDLNLDLRDDLVSDHKPIVFDFAI